MMTVRKSEAMLSAAAYLILAQAALARTRILTFSTPGLELYTLQFDDSLIPESEMRQLAWLAPMLPGVRAGPFDNSRGIDGRRVDKTFIAPALELCVQGDPAYARCGTRAWGDPNFLTNAEANLNRGRAELSRLGHLKHPSELDPVVRYLAENLKFDLWLATTRFEYYRTWDVRLLARSYQGFDPSRACSGILQQVKDAPSRWEKYDLVRYQWPTCVMNCFRSRLGTYPVDAWQRFLNDYKIAEHHEWFSVD